MLNLNLLNLLKVTCNSDQIYAVIKVPQKYKIASNVNTEVKYKYLKQVLM